MALVEARYFTGSITDRRHNADGLAEYCKQFLTSGVWALDDNLNVSAAGGMMVSVGFGEALVDGYPYRLRDNGTGPLTLTVEDADAEPRIDRVVIRKDVAKQRVYAYIKKGDPSASPSPPELTQSGEAYEISLASISVTAEAIEITDDDLTDERADSAVCGTVSLKLILPIHILPGGGGIGIGGVADANEFQVYLPAVFKNTLKIGEYEVWHAGSFDPNTHAICIMTEESDLDNLTTGGIYRLASITNGFPNASWSNLLVVRGGADTITQVGFPYSTGEVYFRSGNTNPASPSYFATNPWKKIWHNGNFNPEDHTAYTGWHIFRTPYGYIELGPVNASTAHIYTDRPHFYFNKDLLVSGKYVYHKGNYETRAGQCTLNSTSTTSVSFSSPMLGTPQSVHVTLSTTTTGDIPSPKMQSKSSSGFTAIIGGPPGLTNILCDYTATWQA